MDASNCNAVVMRVPSDGNRFSARAQRHLDFQTASRRIAVISFCIRNFFCPF
jgi:hypothetical protein